MSDRVDALHDHVASLQLQVYALIGVGFALTLLVMLLALRFRGER